MQALLSSVSENQIVHALFVQNLKQTYFPEFNDNHSYSPLPYSRMASPTPLQSFLGGLGLSIPAHSLLLLNGTAFGISGFIHGAIRGSKEALAAVAGLAIGGMFVGVLEQRHPVSNELSLPRLLFSGLLVGLGSKVRGSVY